jgi:hypothetical protein
VRKDEFHDVLNHELNPSNTFMTEEQVREKKRALKEKFDANTARRYKNDDGGPRLIDEGGSPRLQSSDLEKFRETARREQKAHDYVPRKAAFTPAGTIVKEARKLLHAQQQGHGHADNSSGNLQAGHDYINAKMRESMDSRSAAAMGAGREGRASLETGTTQSFPFHGSAAGGGGGGGEGPMGHLDRISASLGFDALGEEGELFNPKRASDLDDTFRLFGLEEEKRAKRKGKGRGGGGRKKVRGGWVGVGGGGGVGWGGACAAELPHEPSSH